MAQSLTSVHDDLRISITPRFSTRYHGTAAQLIAEGLIPDGFEWPHRSNSASFTMGRFTHRLRRIRPDGIKGPMSIWIEGDYWFLQRSLVAEEGMGFQRALIYQKTQELADILYRQTAEWSRLFHRAYETSKDAKYQAFRLQLLGEPKRGRGRPAKHTTTLSTQGASHV